jgi:predicted nucleic acid-binding protein
MTTLVFVDANVIVYAYDATDRVKHTRAKEWRDHLWRERRGRTSMQVISESYVTLTRKFRVPADAAWDHVGGYLAWRPLAIDEMLLRRAREVQRRYQISWWDSLIVAAAQLQDCVVLLTEDLQDGMVFGTLAVRSPFGPVIEQPAATYSVERAAPLHRPRGRPKGVSDAAYERAYRRWLALHPFPPSGPPQRYPTREEIYEERLDELEKRRKTSRSA